MTFILSSFDIRRFLGIAAAVETGTMHYSSSSSVTEGVTFFRDATAFLLVDFPLLLLDFSSQESLRLCCYFSSSESTTKEVSSWE